MGQPLQILLLGELEVRRGDASAALPPSKKTRALLGYLALTGRTHRRERLCDLLWDVADDRRGALRWSLSKLRALVDDDAGSRIVTEGEGIRLELAGVRVDALEVERALARRPARDLDTDELLRLAASFRGELLEGLDLPDFDGYQAWCIAERENLRRRHVGILAALVERLAGEPERVLAHARTWARLDPVEEKARAALLRALAALGRREEARQHYEAGRRLDAELGRPTPASVEEAFRHAARGRAAAPPPAAPPAPSIPAAPPPAARALVGRTDELADLDELLERAARERRLQVLLLTGEPGVGKSRLLRAWLSAVADGGGFALSATSFELERGRPYAPWLEAFRGVVREGEPDPFAALPAPDSTEPPEAGGRERLHDAVARAVGARLAPETPAALVFDDVQWLDESSAELLHYVARAHRDRPLALVLSARAGETSDNAAVMRLMRALRREGAFAERALGPLDEEASIELARSVRADVDAARVFAQSAGNPLYVLELARADGAGEEVEGSLGGLVRDRLEQLPSEAAEVLRWAAVLGRPTAADELEELVAIDAEAFLAALELLDRRALFVCCAANDRHGFAHDVVRKVVYADLSGLRRKLMHRKVAERLAARAAHDATVIAEVAHHATAAQDSALAARACLGAARRALQLFANADAFALARRGLRHAEALPEPERTRCRIELYEVWIAARPPADRDELVAELQLLAERALDLDSPTHARLGFHLLSYLRWETGDWSEARRLMLRAEAVSRGGGDLQYVVGLAEAARCLVMLERDLGHAQALALEASARGKQVGVEPPALPDALGLLHLHEGAFEDAATEFERARALARAAGQRYGEFQALEHLVVLHLERRDFGEAVVASGELAALAERLRESSEAPFARALAALARVSLGEQAAEAELEETLGALALVDAKHRLAYVLTRAAWLDAERGEHERGEQRARRALGIAELLRRPSELLLARLAIWRCALARGRREEAAELRAQLLAAPREPVAANVRALVERELAGGTKQRGKEEWRRSS